MSSDSPVAGFAIEEVGRTSAAAPPGFDLGRTGLDDFLARMRNAVLATLRADGSPQATPAWFHWDGSVIRISSPGWTRKVANVRRDDRVSVCVDDQLSGTYATMFGRVELVEGESVAAESWPILLKYLHADEAEVRWQRINAEGDRVVIKVHPDKIVWRADVR